MVELVTGPLGELTWKRENVTTWTTEQFRWGALPLTSTVAGQGRLRTLYLRTYSPCCSRGVKYSATSDKFYCTHCLSIFGRTDRHFSASITLGRACEDENHCRSGEACVWLAEPAKDWLAHWFELHGVDVLTIELALGELSLVARELLLSHDDCVASHSVAKPAGAV